MSRKFVSRLLQGKSADQGFHDERGGNGERTRLEIECALTVIESLLAYKIGACRKIADRVDEKDDHENFGESRMEMCAGTLLSLYARYREFSEQLARASGRRGHKRKKLDGERESLCPKKTRFPGTVMDLDSPRSASDHRATFARWRRMSVTCTEP